MMGDFYASDASNLFKLLIYHNIFYMNKTKNNLKN